MAKKRIRKMGDITKNENNNIWNSIVGAGNSCAAFPEEGKKFTKGCLKGVQLVRHFLLEYGFRPPEGMAGKKRRR